MTRHARKAFSAAALGFAVVLVTSQAAGATEAASQTATSHGATSHGATSHGAGSPHQDPTSIVGEIVDVVENPTGEGIWP